ncbi:TPA: Adenine phosphoribosyltransferase 3 [Trebouxia sp. C0006]
MLAYCKASPSQLLRTKYVQQTGPPLQRFAPFERRNRAPVVLRGQHGADIMLLEEKKELVANSIRGVPDFPKKGIMFWDITTLCLDPAAFRCCIEAFAERYRDQRIDVIAGFEARGFIFGPPLALELNCAFVPLRKPGKLPGETIGASYDLEYGSDRIEMHTGHIKKGQRVLLIDDLVATGGTLGAGIKLMQQVQAEIVEAACVIELPELKGRKKVTDAGAKLYVLIEKEGA